MMDLFKLILGVLTSLFKPRARLEAEILILRAATDLAVHVVAVALVIGANRAFSGRVLRQ